MKVHQQFPRGFWDLHLTHSNSSPCTNRHLRPLALDAVAFVSPQDVTKATPQVESQAGGTRWNPTQEQIGILEMLYSRGMRTPNSQQIEHIAVHLSKFGKIQGKNVFYWFQNHKARERQKLKRLGTPKTASFLSFHTSTLMQDKPGIEEPTTSKKKRTSWTFESLIEESSRAFNNKGEEDGSKKTLELFPLHPEARQMN